MVPAEYHILPRLATRILQLLRHLPYFSFGRIEHRDCMQFKFLDIGYRLRHDEAEDMYIPTQEERYSKAARVTLLLCIVIPSGIVVWLAGGNMSDSTAAFLLPICLLLDKMGFNATAAACISALLQCILFLWLSRSRKLTPKQRLTIAITWGMLFALIVRIAIYQAAAALQ